MSAVTFQQKEHYMLSGEGYRFLPFRFMRWSESEVFLANEVGEYVFLDRETFQQFVSRSLQCDDPDYVDLKAKHFLADSSPTVPVELLAAKYRTKKSFLEGFTRLHIFVTTLRCDHSCPYCQVSRVSIDKQKFDMTRETARKAVDLMFCTPAQDIKVEFQGGEPLLNVDLLEFIVDYVNQKNEGIGKRIEYVLATNLAFLSDEILEFLKEHRVLISTSLDGPEFIHNANRPRPGRNSYEITVGNIQRAREALGHDQVSAVMTTTKLSLEHPREIIDEYVHQNFDAIFLRPISPYGFATKSKAISDYSTEKFLSFYKTALGYIIELNRDGVDITEVYTQILLRKILTPFSTGYVDLQSPAGAAIGVCVYNYDGGIYASDEARMLVEMGDRTFLLGDVHQNTYEEIFGGEVARTLVESSCVETLPGCSDCAFQTYCGADPIYNYTTQGDIWGHRPTSTFCKRNMATIRYIFDLMRSGDDFINRLFTSWATNVYLSSNRTNEAVYTRQSYA